MGDNSAIEWTEATWNPTTGCDKVSPGCAHCYAEDVADRFWATQYKRIFVADPEGRPKEEFGAFRDRAFTDVQCHEDRLDQPLRWRRPRKVFVNSMSDLFHEAVPDTFIDQVFAVMALASWHTYQILTKRAERMRTVPTRDGVVAALRARGVNENVILNLRWPLPNVWLGVSVENPPFLKRLDDLMQTPAALRFVSLEPLLADVGHLSRWLNCEACGHSWRWHTAGGMCQGTAAGLECYCVMPREPALDWVIVGGESGTGARPFDIAWARSIVKQCKAAGVPVFVKQLGANVKCGDRRFSFPPPARYIHSEDPLYGVGLRSKKGGDPAEWPKDLRVREFPEVRP